MSSNERFADLFNYYLFQGRQIIKPESLREANIIESVLLKGEEGGLLPKERYRDLLRKCVIKRSGRTFFLLIGLENQEEIHYALPVRHMLYDALNYAGQVQRIAKAHRKNKDRRTRAEFLSGFKRTDKLTPVVTLTLYWGADPWDAPRCLHDMMREEDREILPYVENYHANLVIPGEIEDFRSFRSDLGKILGCVSRYNDREALRKYMEEEASFFSALDAETTALLEGHMGVTIKGNTGEEGGERNVVKAIRDMKMESFAEGLAKGKEKGIAEGIEKGEAQAVQKMAAYFRSQDDSLTEEEAVKMAENILR